MINPLNVVKYGDFTKAKEKKTKSNNNIDNNQQQQTLLARPSVQNLRANFLTFKGNDNNLDNIPSRMPPLPLDAFNKDPELARQLGLITDKEAQAMMPKAQQTKEYTFKDLMQEFVSDPKSPEFKKTTKMPWKEYDKAALTIAKDVSLGRSIVMAHEAGAMPELVMENFADKLKDGKYRNIGLTSQNTEIYFIDTDKLMFEDHAQKVQTMMQEITKEPEKGKHRIFFMKDTDENIKFMQGAVPNSSLIIFGEKQPLQQGGTAINPAMLNPLLGMMGGAPASTSGKNKDIPESKRAILDGAKAAVRHDLEPVGAPEAAKFIRQNIDELVMKKLPEHFQHLKFQKPAIDKAVEITRDSNGSYPGKAVDFLIEAVPAALQHKKISKETEHPNITAKNIEWAATEIAEKKDRLTEITWDTGKKLGDVGGVETIREALSPIIEKIKSGKDIPKGIMITGEKGSGKTLLANAIAGETGSPVVSISSLDFQFSGKNIGKTFAEAKEAAHNSPNKTALLVIDDFGDMANRAQAFYGDRMAGKTPLDMILNKVIEETKKLDNSKGEKVLVVALATNPEQLRPDLIKNDVFASEIKVPDNFANRETRLSTLNILSKELNLNFEPGNKDKILEETAKVTEHTTGADLKAILRKSKEISERRAEKNHITQNDIYEGLIEVNFGSPHNVKVTPERMEQVIKHEAAHATVAQTMSNLSDKYWKNLFEVSFITFKPAGDFAGAVFYSRGENGLPTFDSTIGKMASTFAGLYAEKELFDGKTSSIGPYSDLIQARQNAQSAIKGMGLGPNTGLLTGEPGPNDTELAKNNYQDWKLMTQAASTISEKIVKFHKGFINEYATELMDGLGKGGNTMSAKVFQNKLNTWLDKDNRRQELKKLETEVKQIIEDAREGRPPAGKNPFTGELLNETAPASELRKPSLPYLKKI